ncbi:MAG: phenylacetic acid degradation protein PaaI [Spirochaetae bacterium HGW-Spirochaetae-1]|jgi:acyl-CoA thioesterase|nr:MAG: phenylacetic acid degradation protein PaaI [Spirochaetae bacterium HGW-Spirochaetae-1]
MDKLRDMVREDPYAKLLGILVEEVREGYARCSLTVTGQMLNFLGVPHGGLIFSLADVAFSAASNSDHSPSFALDVSGSFMRAVAVGDTISAEAIRIHTTKRTGIYRMDVKKNDLLIATFQGTVLRKHS